MCADCHSTAVVKGYDRATRSYRTTFTEVSVGCEACHGPGSVHVESDGQQLPVGFPEHRQGEINACAPCHSRRAQLAEGFKPHRPFLDHYSPALLDDGLYFADGQIEDEVYVYGSFLQSRMHAAGVTCSDCHEPHSAGLRAEGNALCVACHNPIGREDFPTLPLAEFDHPDHHLHKPGEAGSFCVDCHMPARTYMVVDDRRDHGFRIPRPDLAAVIEAPNACTGCHQDQSSTWAADVLKVAFGPAGDHFAPAFADGRRGLTHAASGLVAVAENRGHPPGKPRDTHRSSAPRPCHSFVVTRRGGPPGGRRGPRGSIAPGPHRRSTRSGGLATGVSLAMGRAPAPGSSACRAGGSSADPRAAAGNAPCRRPRTAPNRYRRISRCPGIQRRQARVPHEPGRYPSRLGRDDGGRSRLPRGAGAATGLDSGSRQSRRPLPGHEPRCPGRELLSRAARLAPESADVLLAYGLWMVRQDRRTEALQLFHRAAHAPTATWRHAYVHAVALHSTGRLEEALDSLDRGIQANRGDPQLLQTAHGIAQELGDSDRVESYRRQIPSLSAP